MKGTIGEIRTGIQIGNTQECNFVYHACLDCGKERWVKLIHGKPQSLRCNPCASKRFGGKYQRVDLSERFWAKVVKTEGCWIWQGYHIFNGYGVIQVDHKPKLVHRLTYELTKGIALPNGHKFEIDHLCRNKLCVNPEHLELVTHRDNTLRGVGITALHAKATHCPKGHPYDLLNSYPIPTGGRGCRICRKEADDRRRTRHCAV